MTTRTDDVRLAEAGGLWAVLPTTFLSVEAIELVRLYAPKAAIFVSLGTMLVAALALTMAFRAMIKRPWHRRLSLPTVLILSGAAIGSWTGLLGVMVGVLFAIAMWMGIRFYIKQPLRIPGDASH